MYEQEDSSEPTAHFQLEASAGVVRRTSIDWICSHFKCECPTFNNFQTTYRQYKVQEDKVTHRHTGRFLIKTVLLRK